VCPGTRWADRRKGLRQVRRRRFPDRRTHIHNDCSLLGNSGEPQKEEITLRTRNRSFRVVAAAVGAGAMLSTPVLLALATPASAAGTTTPAASTVQSAAVPAANPCPAIRVFNLEGTGAFNGLAPGTAPPPDFQAAAAFSPDRALTNLSQASGGRADYFTINYPAAGGLPIFASERAGVVETERQAVDFVAQCSTSKIELLGYSQGAWVAGDVASDIANNKVPGVTPDKVLASFFVGDPINQATQQPGYGTQIGARTGAGPLPARVAGFGANNATTFEFCNPGDNVCDAPPAAPGSPASFGNIASIIGGPTPPHLMYNTVEVAPGLSSVAYIRQYILAHLPAVVVPPVTTPPVLPPVVVPPVIPPVVTTPPVLPPVVVPPVIPPVTTPPVIPPVVTTPPVIVPVAPPVVTTPPVVVPVAPPVVTTPPVVVPVAPPVVTTPPAAPPVVSDPGATAVVDPGAAPTPFRIDTGLGANAVAAPAPTQVQAAPASTSTNYPMLSGGLGIVMAGVALLLGALYRRRSR